MKTKVFVMNDISKDAILKMPFFVVRQFAMEFQQPGVSYKNKHVWLLFSKVQVVKNMVGMT